MFKPTETLKREQLHDSDDELTQIDLQIEELKI